MIRHTALFRFNEAATKAQIADLMAGLMALKSDISAIERIAWGENFSDRANGHTHVVSMDFPDRAALAVFSKHRAHLQVIEMLIKPITASLLLIEYEERQALGRP
jgi:hypothetical protein